MSIDSDLEVLPLRAIVGFAARCGRRVQPFLDLPTQVESRPYYFWNIEAALIFAERLAITVFDSSGAIYDFACAAQNASRDADEASRQVSIAASDYVNGCSKLAAQRATHACTSAVEAATDAAATLCTIFNFRGGDVVALAAKSASNAVHAALAAESAASSAARAAEFSLHTNPFVEDGTGVSARTAARAAANHDYQMLVNLELGMSGELGTPIDAFETGPLGSLWPDGAPECYTAALERMQPTLETGRQWLRKYIENNPNAADVDIKRSLLE